MIVCTGITKRGAGLNRHRFSIQLEPALMELVKLYDRFGGPLPQVSQTIEEQIERCLGEAGPGRERVQSHLHVLLRARDLNRYAAEHPPLAPLKVSIYEHLLFHRSTETRWASIREALLAGLDLLCKAPWPGLAVNLERYKQALSDRAGPVGRLLSLIALFNLELDGESPPENTMLHFPKGAFPLHVWELCSQGGHSALYNAPEGWSPGNPLCRWEYLAADLLHALLRAEVRARGGSLLSRPGEAPQPWRSEAAPDGGPPPPEEASGSVFCRIEDSEEGPEGDQLELFPFDPSTFLAEVIRATHRREGAEGVKLLALLMGALAQSRPGCPLTVNPMELAALAAGTDLTARGASARVKRLERVIGLLSRIQLTRIESTGGRESVRTSRLLTLLERSAFRTPEKSAGDGDAGRREPDLGEAGEGLPERITLLTDPVFHRGGADNLGRPFLQLPEALLAWSGKDHPYLIALYGYLARCWAGSGTAEPAPVERSAAQLIAEAGLWVSRTGRYRALEALKADLTLLAEQGWLGSWRLRRSPLRDGLEDRYVLTPPPPGAAGAPVLSASEPEKKRNFELDATG